MEKLNDKNESEIINEIIEILKSSNGSMFLYKILRHLEIPYDDADLRYFNAKLKSIRLIEYDGAGAGYYEAFRLSDYGVIYLRNKTYFDFLTEHSAKGSSFDTPTNNPLIGNTMSGTTVSRKQMIEDIRDLIDSNPHEDVDIKSIIEKYTDNLNKNEQQIIRQRITNVLVELKQLGEIYFNDESIFHLNTQLAGDFSSSSCVIRGTIEYENKKAQKAAYNIIDNSINAHGDINAPAISGGIHNTEIKDSFITNPENKVSNEIAKKGLIWAKRNVYVAIIAIAVVVVIYLLSK